MRLTLTTLARNGDLFLYVFTGTVDWSQYGSASRKFCFLPPKRPLTADTRPMLGAAARDAWPTAPVASE
eukprot:2571562-Prymnesium_polylepis.1